MSKKRGRSLKINITLSNRWLYTLILIGILTAIGVGVYAYGTSNPSSFGHSISELAPCAEGQILKTTGGVWTCGTESGGSWKAPTNVKCTTSTHNGNFQLIGDSGSGLGANGYRGMYNWIQTNGCSGYHVCDSTEITRWRQMNNTVCNGWFQIPLLYTYNGLTVSQCSDWTMSLSSNYGTYWSNGRSVESTCDANNLVLCCL